MRCTIRQFRAGLTAVVASTAVAAAAVTAQDFGAPWGISESGAAASGDPRQSAEPDSLCNGLTPLTLTFDPGSLNPGAEHRSESSSNCSLTLIARQTAARSVQAGARASCTIVATPALIEGGLDVEIRQDGDCEGIAVGSVVDVVPRDTKATAAYTTTYHKQIDSRILAHDAISLTMWLIYQQISWDYDGAMVYNGSFPYWQWYDSYWYEIFGTSGAWYEDGGGYYPQYYAYNYRHAYSDGFPTPLNPDTEGWAQSAARAYYTGSFTCEFWQQWGNPYPGFHWHNLCRQI